MTHQQALELWNTCTGGDKHSPATAFAGAMAALGAYKYIPIKYKDFTAGNNTAEVGSAKSALKEWFDALEFPNDPWFKNPD